MAFAPSRRVRGSFLRSTAVGAAATLVDLAALTFLIEVVALAPAAANLPALLLGVLIQFFGNKYFAFKDGSRAYVKQGFQFALVEAGTIALNALAFHVLVTAALLPYGAARLLGTALVYVAFSYPLWSRIFRPQPA